MLEKLAMVIRFHLPSLVSIMLTGTVPAVAQDIVRPTESEIDQAVPPPRPLSQSNPGEVSQSSVGQVGMRQNRETVDVETGIRPMSRIGSRLRNRIQSRISNRIDRFYRPQFNESSSFAAAEAEARTASRRP